MESNNKDKATTNHNEKKLLSVKGLNMFFKSRGTYKKVLDDLSFDVNEGDFFGIIGESGSGKTTTGKVIIKLYQATGGVIEFDNQLISQKKMVKSKQRWMRKNIQMIFQDPMSSMNPIKNVLKIVSEPLVINKIVQKEAWDYIKLITNINRYFKNNFNRANVYNFLNFQKSYYSSILEIYQDSINELNEYKNLEIKNLLEASELIDKLLNNLISKLQKNVEKSYGLVSQQKDLINSTIDKFNANDLHQIDIDLHEATKNLTNIKKLKNNSEKLLDLKKELKELKKEIKNSNKNFHSLYFVDLSEYKKVILYKILSNIKTLNQSKYQSKNNIQYYYFHIQELLQKLIYQTTHFLLKEFKYLSISEIEELSISVEKYILDKFNSPISELLNYEKEFNEADLQKRIEILDNISKYKKTAENIKWILKKGLSIDIINNSTYEPLEFLKFANDIYNEYSNNAESESITKKEKTQKDEYIYEVLQSLSNNLDSTIKLDIDANHYIDVINNLIKEIKAKLINFVVENLPNLSLADYKKIFTTIDEFLANKYDSVIGELQKISLVIDYKNNSSNKNLLTKLKVYDNMIVRMNNILMYKFFILTDEFEIDTFDHYINFVYEIFDKNEKSCDAKINEKLQQDILFDEKLFTLEQKIIEATLEHKQNFNAEEWKKNLISAKENKKNAVAKQREEIIGLKEEWKKDFENRNKIQIEINDLKNKIKNIKKEYKSSIVDFLNIFSKKDTQKQSTFLKKIRKRKFIHSTRKSLNPKWKTQSVIDYELKNSIKSWKINTSLYKSNKATGWLFYSLIKNSIIKQKVYDALVSVGLKHEHAYRYPHEFSGGQRQRIVIARALITKPKLIIADEPISALDVSIQSQVINIMKKLAKEQGVTFLFIAHDLSMVCYACNKMIIMHNGRIVEKGDVKSIFKNPIHPYTKSLFKAIPELSRIHINLASFNENLDYYIKYGPLNKPFFKAVNNSKNHFVFGIQEQFDEWMN